jgi:hypothetical protein
LGAVPRIARSPAVDPMAQPGFGSQATADALAVRTTPVRFGRRFAAGLMKRRQKRNPELRRDCLYWGMQRLN